MIKELSSEDSSSLIRSNSPTVAESIHILLNSFKLVLKAAVALLQTAVFCALLVKQSPADVSARFNSPAKVKFTSSMTRQSLALDDPVASLCAQLKAS